MRGARPFQSCWLESTATGKFNYNWIKIAPHEPLSSAHMWIYFAQNFSQRSKLRVVFHEIVHLICPHEKTGKKVPFLTRIKWNAERRRSGCDDFIRPFLNAVLLNWFIQIYGQNGHFWWFVRKQNAFYGQTDIFQWFVRKFLTIMLGIYGHKPLFGAFVRKNGSETVEFLRTSGHF